MSTASTSAGAGASTSSTSNLPCEDLLSNRGEYVATCIPLYEASVTGDWEAANVFLQQRPELVKFAITENNETALHVVASTKQTERTLRFVENLVNLMDSEDLELKNKDSNTAFCLASAAGNMKMAMIMEEKNHDLPDIPGNDQKMPLYMSASMGKYDTVKYLYEKSNKMSNANWNPKDREWLLVQCVKFNYFDVALKIVTDCPELTKNGDVLRALARNSEAFNGVEQNLIMRIINQMFITLHLKVKPAVEEATDPLKLLTIIWRDNIMKLTQNKILDILRGPRASDHTEERYPDRTSFLAAKIGNTRFLVELIRAYPDLIWRIDDDKYTIFHIAVMHRNEGVYNLMYEIGSLRDGIVKHKDYDGNNMLHLVGATSKKMRSHMHGASLLMQRELLWFKEVEEVVPPSYREMKNKSGKTPYEIFSKENEDLVSQGLKWMKDCMVVATLIVTVAFAVAFTVPGGYSQDRSLDYGLPIFIHHNTFLVFVIADAISLFSSTTSLLVFLSVLTSRHRPRDFLSSLPRKLMIGLVTLFISVAAMMVTFSASFFVLYRNGLKWVPILISAFAAMPVIIFAVLQLPLLVDMFRSVYDSHYLFKPKKRMLYNTNPRF